MTFKHIETCWYFNKLDHRGKPYDWPCCGETSECDEVFVNSLKAENARLREALERITKASMPHEEPVSRMIARDALKGKE